MTSISVVPPASKTDEGGFALISVLVIAGFVALLTLALSTLVLGIAGDSAKLSSDVRIRALAEAGLNRMILAYSRPQDPLRTALVPDDRTVAWNFGGAVLTLRSQAESGKLDVNVADRAHVAALAARVFEDQNGLERFLGAIDAARSSGQRIPSVVSLLAPFDRMTATRDLIQDHFTAMTNQRGFDPLTAPAQIIETMPTLSDAMKRELLAVRGESRQIAFERLSPEITRQFVAERPFYTFRSDVRLDTGRVGAMRAVVGFSEQGDVTIYAWAPASPAR